MTNMSDIKSIATQLKSVRAGSSESLRLTRELIKISKEHKKQLGIQVEDLETVEVIQIQKNPVSGEIKLAQVAEFIKESPKFRRSNSVGAKVATVGKGRFHIHKTIPILDENLDPSH